MSCYFISPTVHLEPVRAFLTAASTTEDDGDGDGAARRQMPRQMKVWMETESGTRVLQGTASVGSSWSNFPPSELEARLIRHRTV